MTCLELYRDANMTCLELYRDANMTCLDLLVSMLCVYRYMYYKFKIADVLISLKGGLSLKIKNLHIQRSVLYSQKVLMK